MKKNKLIVFDMDGVLIDVSLSYRSVVRKTVDIFLKKTMENSDKLPTPLFTLNDLAMVKQSGGLNNDWDLTYLILSLLLSLADKNDASPIALFLKSKQTSIQPIERGPLERLFYEKGRFIHPKIEKYVSKDVKTGNIVKQIFQEIYLGSYLFRKTYRIKNRFYSGKGYIEKESLIFDNSVLGHLREKAILAIATGRPKNEAEYALEYFNIRDLFSSVITLEHCISEEKRIFREERKIVTLSKPDPFMLDLLGNQFEETVDTFFFVGDMPDDMIAAKRSHFNYIGIGFLNAESINNDHREKIEETLLKKGAKVVLKSIEEVKKYFE